MTGKVGGGISPGDLTVQPAPSNTDYDEFIYELRRKSMRHTSASMHAYDFTCGCELCVALPTIRAMADELAAARAEAEQLPRVVALTLAFVGGTDGAVGDAIPQDVWTQLHDDGLVRTVRDITGEGVTLTTPEGRDALLAALAEAAPEETP